jgi:hypothetical protein
MTPLDLRPRADLKALVAVANPADLEKYPNLAPVDVAGEVARSQAALKESFAEIGVKGGYRGLGRRCERDGEEVEGFIRLFSPLQPRQTACFGSLVLSNDPLSAEAAMPQPAPVAPVRR